MTKKKSSNFLLEFIDRIYPYKISIFFITLIGMVISAINLYLQPSIYEAKAVLKVKTQDNQILREFNSAEQYSKQSDNIDQDLAILQTYYIHKNAIEKLNLNVQYFIKKRYKKIELLDDSPIEIKDIEISDGMVGKYITLIPQKYGFYLEIDSKKYKNFFEYGKLVETDWFRFRVYKKSDFDMPIFIKLNGDSRNIYENIIKKKFKATRVNENASLIRISYQDTSTKRAIDYLNNLMKFIIEQSIKNKSRQNDKILNFINRQLKETGKELKLSESKLERFRIENNVIEPTNQSRILLDKLSDIELELSQIKIEKRLIDNTLRYVTRGRKLTGITPTLRELQADTTIRSIENLQNLRQRLNELSQEFTPKHPEIKTIEKNIDLVKRGIFEDIKKLKRNILQRESSLLKLKREYEASLKSLPTKEKELIDLQRNHEVNSKMYSYLLEKQAENSMKKVATIPDYEIIDSAYASKIPIKPKRAMGVAISTIFSLIFASLFAYWRSSLVNRLQTIKDLDTLTPLPLYGELPILENSKFLTTDSEQLLKAFRNLRTKINFSHPKMKGNVVTVTSSREEREAKSNIVANLGYIFQKANYKTLIIDFDLYYPILHKLFDLELNVGVSDFLARQEDNIERLVQHTKYSKLDIITAGSLRDDASELILSKRLYFLLGILKKKYDYIFIDAIPLTLEADVLYIMKYSDVNLIVVQQEITKKSFIESIQDYIGEYKFKNIAILAVTNS
jgi:capsular exopolysaccharide synthesis family protein